jgi:hypothetical protein
MPPSLVAPRRSKKSWQTSRLWKRIVLWAVLTLTITVVILFALQEFVRVVDELVFPESQYVYHDSSPKPVVLGLGNGHISIPRDYVETYFPPAGKTIGILMIGAFLPNFVPERIYAASHPNPAFHPWIAPDIKEYDKALVQASITSATPAIPDPSAQAGLEQQFKDEEQFYTFDFSELNNFDEWVDRYGNKLFVHRGTDRYWINCMSGCTIIYVYRGTFGIQLNIDPANLHYAEAIKQNFNKFFDSQIKIVN